MKGLTLDAAKALPEGELFVRWSSEYFRHSTQIVVSPIRAQFSKGDLRQAVRKLHNAETLPNFASQAEIVAFAGNSFGMRGYRWLHAQRFTTENPIKVRPASDIPLPPPPRPR